MTTKATRLSIIWLLVLAMGQIPGASAGASDVPSLLATIKAVKKEGSGNIEASKAWKELVVKGPRVIMEILAAMDDCNQPATNWLRTAVDAIAEGELAARRTLPADKLEAFVRDTRHSGIARRLAYEWLVQVDQAAPGRLLPGLLNDPGAELRRDAVAHGVKNSLRLLEKGDKEGAKASLQRILPSARDRDQVEAIAKELKQLGDVIDVTAHFGFIPCWKLIGPFDNTDGAGFAKEFPPEKKIDLDGSFPGKKDTMLRWIAHTSAAPYGLVDLNKALGKNMGATAYAFTVVSSAKERQVEIRAGRNNALKIFLNGKEIFFREEYHHGMRMDQHVGTGTLKAGRNEILVKVCQNQQTDEWAQTWSFQLRVCDVLGGAVPLTLLTEKTAAKQPVSEKGRP